MKRIEISDQLKRASEVIKNDRLGVSVGLEEVVGREVEVLLSEYFSLSDSLKTKIEVNSNGFYITIQAKARSVKQFKIIG